jgi:hypothetical protein
VLDGMPVASTTLPAAKALGWIPTPSMQDLGPRIVGIEEQQKFSLDFLTNWEH